ncbi:MAG TPA: DNA cytosine methyltransferase, partial [Caulobacteraceae bacterium]|nr:DNA cytosine methyltransferase [Caulobacteraceae bacterium]
MVDTDTSPAFFEFFAGGGMARAGLSPEWQCWFANDFDHKKGSIYRQNWGDKELLTADIRGLSLANLPPIRPDLVWASFPCQDLSLAGAGAGLRGDRSGTFWPFWRLVEALVQDGRAPDIVTLENVCGTLTSHEGKDFTAIVSAFAQLGYRVGALVVDAQLFVPQSRPRLFFVGVRRDHDGLATEQASDLWHPTALRRAFDRLGPTLQQSWIWWDLPAPNRRNQRLIDIVEPSPADVDWHSPGETGRLLSMMSDLHRAKIQRAVENGSKIVGGLYRRTRRDENDNPIQRAEVRFDDVAGCLRTPAGGSSRQTLIVVDDGQIRSRLVSGRETARLMGLPDSFELPNRYNETYHLTGDGVAVPVVRHL